MARKLRIHDSTLEEQVNGVDAVYIGKKLFVAVAVDDVSEESELTPEEVQMVKESLADARPSLRGKSAMEYLQRAAKELDLD